MIPAESAFKNAIYKALCACFSLQPTSDQAKALIHEAYNEPENTPRPARTVDIVYWSIEPEGSIPDPVSYEYRPTASSAMCRIAIKRPLAFSLLIVCYGSNCMANAHKIRSFIFVDGKDLPRQILRAAGIFPVKNPPAPTFMYEPEGSLWRRRSDLRIQLIVEDELTYPTEQNAIQHAPAVIINH